MGREMLGVTLGQGLSTLELKLSIFRIAADRLVVVVRSLVPDTSGGFDGRSG